MRQPLVRKRQTAYGYGIRLILRTHLQTEDCTHVNSGTSYENHFNVVWFYDMANRRVAA